MGMCFSDATKASAGLAPAPEYHPRFCKMMRDVASGRKTVDEAWSEWVAFCAADGTGPVNRDPPPAPRKPPQADAAE